MLKRRGKGGIWTTRFTSPDGTRIHRSTETTDRRLAQEFEDRLKSELWRIAKLGDAPRRSWQEAVVRWLDDRSAKDTIEKDRANLLWLDPHLGILYLDEISEDLLREVARVRGSEPANKRATSAPRTAPNKRRKPAVAPAGRPPKRTSPATVNRMLALIRSILRAARDEWKWGTPVPVVPMLAEPQHDVPVVTRDMAARVFSELPAHLRPLFAFALSVGLREQNVLRLRWDDVDMARASARIPGMQTKAGKPIPVPLNADALAILQRQRAEHPVGEWAFPSPRGAPYTRANNTAWRSARMRAGVPWLRWHDLRHAWAQWHAQAGTPLLALKELGAWSSLAMVERYAAFAVDHLADHARRIEGCAPLRADLRNARAEVACGDGSPEGFSDDSCAFGEACAASARTGAD